MRRSASEIIRNLEQRIARLEGSKSQRTAGGFYGDTTKIDNNKCVIMLETYDSSETFDYCFMHLDSGVLNSAVKSFMSDMQKGQKLGIVEYARITSKSGSCVCIRVEMSEDWDQMDSRLSDWLMKHCWERPNTINIG